MRKSKSFYSRYVSLMKIILPLGMLLSIGFVIGWPYLLSLSKENLVKIDTNQPDIKENRMVHPHYISTDEKGQPFHLNAEWAKQKPDNFADLVHPHGSMTMLEGATFNVEAEEGHYNNQNKILILEKNVIVTSTDGDVIKTAKAEVDIGKGVIKGVHPIKGEGKMGEFMGQGGFMVEKRPKGKKITLKGRSRVVIKKASEMKNKNSAKN